VAGFFFFGLVYRRQIWPLRVAGPLPLAVGVDRGHPRWPDLFFFFLGSGSPEVAAFVAGDGGGRR
jgi:hypothetical protein